MIQYLSMQRDFSFELTYQDAQTHARCGIIHTPHGDIETPAFVPVGTQATVKSLNVDELKELNVHMFFVNTYHMYLRPGLDVIQTFGGLHHFMGWDRPIITDSGGFQIFSLGRKKYSHSLNQLGSIAVPAGRQDSRNQVVERDQNASPVLVKISDDGVEFQSHWDGTKHVFTPERSMEYQWILGSDIHIAFDDCTPYGVKYEKAKRSMERTHAWAKRSLIRHQELSKNPAVAKALAGNQEPGTKNKELSSKNKVYQALYGSIQGSVFEELRKTSAAFITSLPFDGFAIGGVSVGESKEEMQNVLDWVMPMLPEDKPRHLLGVGEIDDIFALIEHGVDTFDCVQPTRLARVGRLYSFGEDKKPCEVDITKAVYAHDKGPNDEGCQCYTCTHVTRGYLHHLFKTRELLGYRLATIHNIFWIQSLVSQIRLAIREGRLVALKNAWL